MSADEAIPADELKWPRNVPEWLIDRIGPRVQAIMHSRVKRGSDRPITHLDLFDLLLDECRLSPAHREVLRVLSGFRSGSAEPSLELIAYRVGVSEGTARKVIRELETWGWLRVEKRRHRPHAYVVTVPVEEPPNRVPVKARGATVEPLGSSDCTPGVQRLNPEGSNGCTRGVVEGSSGSARGSSPRGDTSAVSEPVVAANNGLHITAGSDDPADGPLWHQAIVGIEAREADGRLPRLPSKRRHDIARVLARWYEDDPEVIDFTLDCMARREPSSASSTWRAVSHCCGLSPAAAWHLAGPNWRTA